jgi:hypothetical protein
MTNKALFTLVALFLCGTFPALGRSQAAVEYGLATAAAAATSKASPAVNEALKQTGEKLQQAMAGTGTNATLGTTAPAAPSTSTPIATKTLETLMKENQAKLQPKAEQGGATIRIDSAPARARILIDGAVVGYTPMELKLASGQHLVELKQDDSLPWRKEVSIDPGETVSLKPVLQYKYQSVVTLSSGK